MKEYLVVVGPWKWDQGVGVADGSTKDDFPRVGILPEVPEI
jgi:hypothetical protein